MSNKIVPGVYRAVIDEVISAIRPAFDEFDITPDVLQELQHKWETKILVSRVADFGSVHSSTPSPSPLPGRISKNVAPVLRAPLYPALALPGPSLPPLPGPSLPLLPRPRYSHTQPPFNPDADPRYALPTSYLPPPLAFGTGGNGLQQQQQQNQQNQQNPNRAQYDEIFDPFSVPGPLQHMPVYRLPQTDGPSGSLYSSYSDEEDEDEDELEGEKEDAKAKAAPPRAGHPSVAPRPSAPTTTAPTAPTDDSGLTSDLDDSDTSSLDGSDAAEGGGGEAGVEGDILFCTYEKVTRTKNKWKCVLKDGVVHAGGRDWLFGRCTGEFEW